MSSFISVVIKIVLLLIFAQIAIVSVAAPRQVVQVENSPFKWCDDIDIEYVYDNVEDDLDDSFDAIDPSQYQ